jgi:hypothetical protein
MQKVHDATKSMLNGKRVLLVDDEPDVLDVLKEEISAAAPRCVIDTAQSYRDATALLASWTYDLAILDIMGVVPFLEDVLTNEYGPVWRRILKQVEGSSARAGVRIGGSPMPNSGPNSKKGLTGKGIRAGEVDRF